MGLKVLINFSPHLFYLKCNILFTHLFVNSYLYARCQGFKDEQRMNPLRIYSLVHKFTTSFFFLKLLYLFIYLFLAVLGLRFCARAFSSCGERGPLFIAVRGPLTVAASLAAEHKLQTRRLSSCGSRAQLLCGMWDLPRPGLEPVSPALAGRFSTTALPGKPRNDSFLYLTSSKIRTENIFILAMITC